MKKETNTPALALAAPAAPPGTIVTIEGWDIEVDGRAAWVRDTELAIHAGVRPNNLRAAIRRGLEDGTIEAFKGGDYSEVTLELPTARALVENVEGNVTTTYRLNRSAAVEMVMKMRTPKAREFRRSVVRVFLKALAGEADAATVDAERAQKAVADIRRSVEELREQAERAQLATHRIMRTECHHLMGVVAEHEGSTWRRVHGQLRKQYSVAGYKHLSVLLYERVVRPELLARAVAPVVRPIAKLAQSNRQLHLFSKDGVRVGGGGAS